MVVKIILRSSAPNRRTFQTSKGVSLNPNLYRVCPLYCSHAGGMQKRCIIAVHAQSGHHRSGKDIASLSVATGVEEWGDLSPCLLEYIRG
jgi:hypothetical protein